MGLSKVGDPTSEVGRATVAQDMGEVPETNRSEEDIHGGVWLCVWCWMPKAEERSPSTGFRKSLGKTKEKDTKR